MKNNFISSLLLCLMFILMSCGTSKKTQTVELPVQDFSQTAISLGDLDGYALKVFYCLGSKETQDVLLYFGFAHNIANHEIKLKANEAFSAEGDIYSACVRNIDTGNANCFESVTFLARTDETKNACAKIESVLPSIDRITEYRMTYTLGSPFYKSGEIIIKNIPIHWQ